MVSYCLCGRCSVSIQLDITGIELLRILDILQIELFSYNFYTPSPTQCALLSAELRLCSLLNLVGTSPQINSSFQTQLKFVSPQVKNSHYNFRAMEFSFDIVLNFDLLG